MSGDRLLENIDRMMRDDEFIKDMCNTTGTEYDIARAIIQDIKDNLTLDTMTWALDIEAHNLGLKFTEEHTREDKIAVIRGKLRSGRKVSTIMLQEICDAWKRGSVNASFVNERIEIKFIDIGGIPKDLESLQERLYETRPAHLPIEYIFKWLTCAMFSSWNLTAAEFNEANLTGPEWNATIFRPV